MKRLSSVIILGVGVLLCSGSPTRAQLGSMGEAVKKGAGEAAQKELMKQAGLETPAAPAATPGAATGAAATPADAPKAAPAAGAGADTGAEKAPAAAPGAENAPAGEPEAAPGAAETPAAPAAGGAEKTMMDKAGDKVMEEGAKKMLPKLP